MCRWRFRVQCINGDQCIDRHNRRQPDSPLIEYCLIAIEANRRHCVPESMTESHTPIPGWTACPYCRIAALPSGNINNVTLEELFSGDGTEGQQSGSSTRQPSVRVGGTFINVSSYTSEFVPYSVLRQNTEHQRTTFPFVASAPPSFNPAGPSPTLSTTETGNVDGQQIPQSPLQDQASRASRQSSSGQRPDEDGFTDPKS